MQSIDEIEADFELLDDWDDRYRYLIELGRQLPPFPDEARTDANKVRGCASQVWLVDRPAAADPGRITFLGDSDAHIVRGLVAIALALFSDRRPAEILDLDADAAFRRLGLGEHLTPQRANGLRSMVARMKSSARERSAA